MALHSQPRPRPGCPTHSEVPLCGLSLANTRVVSRRSTRPGLSQALYRPQFLRYGVSPQSACAPLLIRMETFPFRRPCPGMDSRCTSPNIARNGYRCLIRSAKCDMNRGCVLYQFASLQRVDLQLRVHNSGTDIWHISTYIYRHINLSSSF